MDLGHKGKTVIISGGSKGIGAGISEVFAQEGANLVINYHRNKESCLEFAGYLSERYGIRTATVQGDVGKEEDVAAIFDCATQNFGRIDILVNNAGRGVSKNLPISHWRIGISV